MKKRLLAILISAAMVVSMLPSYAFAETAADDPEDFEIIEMQETEDPVSAEDDLFVVTEDEEETADEPAAVPLKTEPAEEAAEVVPANAAEDAVEIKAGETKTAEITEGGGEAWFRFVPEQSGSYMFTSFYDGDTYGYIYDADMEEIDSSDDDGDGNNFKLINHLTAGETYYYMARFYSSSSTGSFEVSLNKDNNLTAHAYDNETWIETAPGESAELKVEASADDMEAVSYQWQKYEKYYYTPEGSEEEEFFSDYVDIAGAESDSYVLENVQKSEQVRCHVTDTYGGSVYVEFDVTVNNHFNAEAENETVLTNYGGTAELKVIVSADKTDKVTYQWSEILDDDGNMTDIDGATGDSYSVTNVTEAKQYACYVEDGYGGSTSVGFTVSVENGLTVTAAVGEWDEDDGRYVVKNAPGTQTVLSVNVSAADEEGLTIEWYEGWDAYDQIEGAAESQYTIASTSSGSNYYTCKVTDRYGTTKTVKFTVIGTNDFKAWASEDYDEDAGETYYNTSMDIEAEPGQELVLTAYASALDKSKMTYTWSAYDPEESAFKELTDAKTETLAVQDLSIPEYRCTVEDGYGSSQDLYYYINIDNEFRAWAREEDGWYDNNNYIYVAPQAAVELKAYVQAKDMSKMSYTWFVKDAEGEIQAVEGAVSDTYAIDTVTGRAEYRCYVSDGYRNSEYLYYFIYVDNHLSAQAVGSTRVVVDAGGAAELKVLVTADNTEGLVYEWFEYVPGTGYQKIEGADGTTLNITAAETKEYRFEVKDPYGNSDSVDFSVFSVTDLTEGTRTEQLTTSRSLVWYRFVPAADDEYVFEAKSGSGESVYIEQYNSELNEQNSSYGEISSYLKAGETCYYRMEIYNWNEAESAEVTVTLKTGNNFRITAEQSYIEVAPKGDAVMKTIVSGKDLKDVAYEWYELKDVVHEEDGDSWTEEEYVKIEGADQDTYTAAGVTAARQFRCTAADAYGTKRSVDFDVYVDNQFQASTKQRRFYVEPGSDANLEVSVSGIDLEGVTYQWYEETERYSEEDDDYYQDWVLIEGAVSDSYTVTDVTGYKQFRCTAKDQYGSTASVTFRVYVENNFHVWPQGADYYQYSRTYSETAHLYPENEGPVELKVNCTAKHTENLKYTWYKDEGEYVWNEGSGVSWQANSEIIEGAAGSVYSAEYKTGIYNCTVDDGYGNTETVTFVISLPSGLSAEAASDTNIVVSEEETAELSAAVTILEGLSYSCQWYRAEFEEETGDWLLKELEGSTGPSILAGEGKYVFIVTDEYGNSEALQFRILEAADITSGSTVNAEITQAGESVWFRFVPEEEREYVIYSASDRDTYVSLYDASMYLIENDDDGGSNSNFRLSRHLNAGETYYYEVRYYGNSGTGTIPVVFEKGNNFAAYAEKDAIYAEYGSDATMKVLVSGEKTENVTYQWYEGIRREDAEGSYTDWQVATEENTAEYTAAGITGSKRYRCYVTDAFGTSLYVYFNIYIENHFSVWPEGAEQYEDGRYSDTAFLQPQTGTSVELKTNVTADNAEGLTFKWFEREYNYNSNEMIGTWKPVSEAAGDTLIRDRKAGAYRCNVTDQFGNSGWAYFEVQIPSGLEVSAVSRTSILGSDGEKITFSVSVSIDAGVSFSGQWYIPAYDEKTGWTLEPAEGETGTSITVDGGNTRKYIFIATDEFGNMDWQVFTAVETLDLLPGYAMVSISEEGIPAYLKFVPESDNDYTLSSDADSDTFVTLYDADMNEIASDDDSGDNNNFLINYELEAGKTYYYSVRFYNSSSTGEIPVLLKAGNNFKAVPVGDTDLRVEPSADVDLAVSVSGNDLTGVVYQWYENTRNTMYFEENWRPIIGAVSDRYPISNCTGVRYLRCVASDFYGNHRDVQFNVSIDNKLEAWYEYKGEKYQQASLFVPAGADTELKVSVSAKEKDGIAYNWYYHMPEGYGEYKDSDTLVLPAVSGNGFVECNIIDKYENSVFVRFNILMLEPGQASPGEGQEKISIETAAVTIPEQTYTGSALTPRPTVVLDGTTLKQGTDYSVEYRNNTEVGTATAVITGEGDYTGTIEKTFVIKAPYIAVTGITLNQTEAELAIESTLQLTATVAPANATNKTITWTSSDEKIATVDENGLVTALKYDKNGVTITAAGADGKSASCEISLLFKDVANHGKSYFDPVYWAVGKGITNVSVSFRPDDPVNRGEFTAFLYRLAGKPKVSKITDKFTDVKQNTKFAKEISWAVSAGVINGYKDGTFRPTDEITRAQVAIMIWRYAGRPTVKVKKSPFPDVELNDSDTSKAIIWGNKNGIMKGSGGKFLPKDTCTRGQTVTFLFRYADKFM